MKRLAIVTGASSGIGLAVARLLATQDCELVLASRRQGPMEELASSIPTAKIRIVPTDVTDIDACRDLVRMAEEIGTDRYPVLINAAGVAHFGPFADLTTEQVLEQLQVNLRAPTLLCHAALPWMLRLGGGQIINVLSVTAGQTFSGTSVYSAAKAGLLMLGKVIAADYRKQGIRVTSILPGAVDTPIWDDKSFVPDRASMLPVAAVAEAIRDLVVMPHDRSVDELLLMPPKGFL
jgi:3-oxoacyl-[acyl-carrier protein] reductase